MQKWETGKGRVWSVHNPIWLDGACMCVLSSSVVSDSLRSFGLQPTRLLCPWYFSGKSTGGDCYFLLQGIFRTQGLNLCLLHCMRIIYLLSHREASVNPAPLSFRSLMMVLLFIHRIIHFQSHRKIFNSRKTWVKHLISQVRKPTTGWQMLKVTKFIKKSLRMKP